jgi:hypothetical protein
VTGKGSRGVSKVQLAEALGQANVRICRRAIDWRRCGLGSGGTWILAVVDMSRSGSSDDRHATPDVYRGAAGKPGPILFTLDVDGEQFAISQGGYGGTNYDWLSGPNKGYGFTSSGTANRSVEEHKESIRVFLSMIDPNTGYIGDD